MARVSRWRRRSSPSRAATAWAEPTRRRSSCSASSPSPLRELRRLGSALPQIFLLDDDAAPLLTDAGLDEIRAFADGIGPYKLLIERDPTLVARAHRRGLAVHSWTFRADDVGSGYATFEDELRAFYEKFGVDGLFTDFPDRARSWLDSHTAAAPLMAARLSVLVPTRNEADNVAPLVERLERCLLDTGCEVVFVDDSDDDTPERGSARRRERGGRRRADRAPSRRARWRSRRRRDRRARAPPAASGCA